MFLTAFSTKQFKNLAKGINVEQVYEKPISIDTLKSIVESE